MASMPNLPRWSPYDDWRSWLRGLVITLAAATFLAFGGAFGSDSASLPVRLAYWLGLMIVGWIWGGFVSRTFFSAASASPSGCGCGSCSRR